MPIPRSKSTPLVAASASTSSSPDARHNSTQRPDGQHISRLQRHHSTTTLHTLRKSSLSGYVHTPKIDEDPFSLAGFFPTHSALDSARAGWDWLRFDMEETLTEEPEEMEGEWYTGYASPVSEDDSVPSTPGGLLSPAGDEQTRVAIEAQDKLGVLGLRDLFISTDNDGVRDARQPYGPLLSPYSEDGPADHDGLYSHLCALRQGHSSTSAMPAEKERCSCSGLFSPVDETLDSKLAADVREHETLVYQGLRRMLDMLPF